MEKDYTNIGSDIVESIKIGTGFPKEKVNEIILSYPLATKVQIENQVHGNDEFFIFNIDKHKIDNSKLFSSIVNLTQRIINLLYMEEIIRDKVSYMLNDFSRNDVERIGDTVLDLLLDEEYFSNDKKMINDELRDYLLENDTLYLDGYIKFRAKSFNILVDKIIEKIATDLEMESEYEEFIHMLQYYLDTQMPKFNSINVIIKNDNFYLLDDNGNEVPTDMFDSIFDEYKAEDISKADMLVTSLVILSPDKVVMHLKNDNERELMQMLKKIFGNRLSFCYSCSICDVNINNSDNVES